MDGGVIGVAERRQVKWVAGRDITLHLEPAVDEDLLTFGQLRLRS